MKPTLSFSAISRRVLLSTAAALPTLSELVVAVQAGPSPASRHEDLVTMAALPGPSLPRGFLF
jgi:hypothetical protein